MSISRNFLLLGTVYLVVGIFLGMYMGGSNDHTLAPVHAHINLLGFTLMTLFGLAYRVIPGVAEGLLPKLHFWLHQVGVFVLLLGLFLLMSGRAAPESIGPVFPFAEGAVMLGVLCWLANLVKRA